MIENNPDKIKSIELTFFLVVLAIAGISLYYLGPSITGLVIKEFSYAKELNLVVTSSGNYTFQLEDVGSLKSIKINGRVTNYGKVRVYIESSGIRYLIFDSAQLNKSSEKKLPNGIDLATESTPQNNSEELQNLTKIIDAKLNYNSGTIYDSDDNGEESLNGVVDLSINAKFNRDIDESRLCSRWEVYNIESETLTAFCNGNAECCGFIGLAPRKSNWSEIYYSTLGSDDAGNDNIVSAQVIYYDVNLSIDAPKSDIDYSGWSNLSVRFFEDETKFENACIDTCALEGLNKSSYDLIFEIEDSAILRIDSVEYSLLTGTANNPPLLLQNFSTINLYKNATINMSSYFKDPDGDRLDYRFYNADNISIMFNGELATLTPEKFADGIKFAFASANDSESVAYSNVFMINVSSQETKPIVEIGKPVTWLKRVFAESNLSSINLTLDRGAFNIKAVVSGFKLQDDKMQIAENGTLKEKAIFESEKEAHRIKRKIAILEEAKSKGASKILVDGKVIDKKQIEENLALLYGKDTAYLNVSNEEPIVLVINEAIAQNSEIVVEYNTESPILIEQELNPFTKKIDIVSDDSYQDVIAYTSLKDVPQQAIKFYWIKNGIMEVFSDVKYIDENNNGLIDKIKWVVPHLSNQTFIVSISVLNVQSFPTVGGNWTVAFNTTGTGDLTILASNGTSYAEEQEDDSSTINDLDILELRCGSDALEPLYIVENKKSYDLLKKNQLKEHSYGIIGVYYENYNCDGLTSYFTVKVLTQGKHTQQFNFSGQAAYANNFALEKKYNKSILISQNKAVFTIEGINNISFALFKNVSDAWNLISTNLFADEPEPNKWEFGANDTSSSGWDNYKYIISSNIPLSQLEPELYGENQYYYSLNFSNKYRIDVSDICSQINPITLETANCKYKKYSLNLLGTAYYFLEVNFLNNGTIDPSVRSISTCANLTESDTQYDLTSDVKSDRTCFIINRTANTTLDCHGFNVNYSVGAGVSSGIGAFVNFSNNTIIRSCGFFTNGSATASTQAVHVVKGINITIYNNTISTNGSNAYGILLNATTNNSLVYANNITTYGKAGHAIWLATNASNISVYSNIINTSGTGTVTTARGNAHGIYLSFNTYRNDIFLNNITASGTDSIGIFLNLTSTNNSVYRNRIRMTGTNADGIDLNINATNSNIYENIINITDLNGIVLSNNASNNSVYDNWIFVGSGADGIPLYLLNHAFNNDIHGNNITSKSSAVSSAIYLLQVTYNNSIYNNNILSTCGGSACATSSDGYGITLDTVAFENNIYNNNITAEVEGISLDTNTFNNSIHDNNITLIGVNTANNRGGIYLLSTSTNNSIYNNVITINRSNVDGIALDTTASYNSIYTNNITIRGVGGNGIVLSAKIFKNDIYNNTIQTQGNFSHGLYLGDGVFNNTIYDNNITALNASGSFGIYLLGNVTNNTFYRNRISSLSNGIVANRTGTSAWVNFNTFTNDTIVPCSSRCASNYQDVVLTANASLTFTNVNFNKSRIFFIARSESAPREKNNLTLQWLLNVNVTNSANGKAIRQALVDVNDSKAVNLFSSTTDATGYVGATYVTELIMNGTVPQIYDWNVGCYNISSVNLTSCFTPLNMSASKSGFTTNLTYYFNWSSNVTLMLTSFDIDISSCTNLTESNMQYNLLNDVQSDTTCFIINSTVNTTLNCHGFNINYSVGDTSSDGQGVLINFSNNTIVKSCYLFTNGSASGASTQAIQALLSSNVSIFNNSIFVNGSNSTYGVVLNFTTNSSVYSNNITIISQQGKAIFFVSLSDNNTIYSNIITTKNRPDGIRLVNTSNTSIYNNTITLNGTPIAGQGILVSIDSNSNSIYSNIIDFRGNSAHSIYINTRSNNNKVYSNNITTLGTSTRGVRLEANSHNNEVFDNNMSINGAGGFGIWLRASNGSNNRLYRNNISIAGSSSSHGLIIELNAYNNLIYSNVFSIHNSTSHGIFFNSGGTFNNTFYDNNITTRNTTKSFGIYLLGNATNNTFYRNRISSVMAAIVINGSGGPQSYSYFNTFTNDTIIPCSVGCSGNYSDVIITSNATDITFANVNFNKSRIKFIVRDESFPVEINNLTIQWLLNVNVTNATDGTSVNKAQVDVNNSNSVNLFSGLTSATGYALLNSSYMTELMMNGTVPEIYDWNVGCYNITNINLTYCFTPFNFSANLSGFTTNLTYYFNWSSNVTLILPSVADSTQISSCKNLTESNAQYNLIQDVKSDTTCFTINNTVNTTLDCHGFNVNYSVGAGVSSGIGAFVNFSNNTIIRSCRFFTNGSATASTQAVHVVKGINITIYNNSITTNGSYAFGIILNVSTNMSSVYNNNITTRGRYGFGIWLSNNASNNSIYSNRINNSEANGYGIYLKENDYGNDIFLNNVTTNGSSGFGIFLNKTVDNSVYRNNITTRGSSAYGIFLDANSTNNFVYMNNVTTIGSSADGMRVLTSHNNSLYNNTISTDGSSADGIAVSTTAFNNSVYFNKVGVRGSSAYGIIVSKTVYNNNIYNNIATISGTGGIGIGVFTTAFNNFVYNNTISTVEVGGTAANGMNLGPTAFNNSIYNNDITTGGYGMSVTSPFFNNSIYGNTITVGDSLWIGINLNGGDNNSIYQNIIRTTVSNTNGIDTGTGTYNYIYENIVITTASTSDAISLTSSNNFIYSNNITTRGSSSDGIYADSIHDFIYGNNITTVGASANGIWMTSNNNNNSVYNNTIVTRGDYGGGVSLDTTAYKNDIYGNRIRNYGREGYGVFLTSTAYKNSIYSNNITTNGSNGHGIVLSSSAYENDVYDNNITLTRIGGVGIVLADTSYNNSVYNNTITTYGANGTGISLNDTVYRNYIYNNNITTYNISSYGIYLKSKVSNNTIYDNNITALNSSGSFGIYLLNNATNNTFYRNIISSLAGGIVINGSGGPQSIVDKNYFTNDTIVPCSVGCSSNYQDVVLTSNASVTFTNVNFNKSRIKFIVRDESFPVEINNLTIQWLLNVNVTNSTNGKAVNNVQVDVNSSNSVNLFSGLTSATGYALLNSSYATELVMNGTVPEIYDWNVGCYNITNINLTYCFTPFNFSANLSGFTTNLTYYFNWSSNVTLIFPSVADATQISSCANLTESNAQYILIRDVQSDTTCFTINNTVNTTLDCDGFSINYSVGAGVSSGMGVFVNFSNNTIIRSCKFFTNGSATASTQAIYAFSSSNVSIYNNLIITNGSSAYGIVLNGSNNNSFVYDNKINTEGKWGGAILLSNNSFNNSIFSNKINTTGISGFGVYLNYIAHRNDIFLNNITTLGDGGNGIYLNLTVANNSVHDNIIVTKGGSNGNSIGISLANNATNNNIYGNYINTSFNDGIRLSMNASNNSIYYNIVLSSISGSDGGGVVLLDHAYNNKIYNNNITNLGAIGGGTFGGIYASRQVYNNSIYNNNIKACTTCTTSPDGIDLQTMVYGNSIHDNNITSNEAGIDSAGAFNNSIYKNNITVVTGSGNFGICGINLGTTTTNNSVYQNIIKITRSSDYGVCLDTTVSYNSIYDNIITTYSTNSIGIYFVTTAFNNYVYKNNITLMQGSTSATIYPGISLTSARNNSIYENNITTNGTNAVGIYSVTGVVNNSIYNNSILTSGNKTHGIFLDTGSFNNTIYNNNITAWNNNASFGIYFEKTANNNTFYRNRITSLSSGIVMNGTGAWVNFNTFTNDTIVPCSVGCSSNYQDVILTANVTDITFLNVSFNKSRVVFAPRDLSTSVEKNNITVKWYLGVAVLKSSDSTPIQNAQVVINDTFLTNIFNGSTDSGGEIITQIITEYTQNGSLPLFYTDTCADPALVGNENITCFSPFNFSVNITGYNPASLMYWLNRSKNLTISLATPPDLIPPVVNASFNISSFFVNNVVNFSCNITDETGLSTANITYNVSGILTKVNFIISGASANVYNVTSLPTGGIFNFTCFATDTTNVKQNSTLISVIDNVVPVVNTTFNKSISFIEIYDVINLTANVTDETGLDTGQIIVNDTGFVRYFNFTLSGTTAKFSQNISVSCSTCIINFTARVNDTSGNTKTNDTIVTVTPQIEVANCTNLTRTNANYTLVNNASSDGTCFYILANNITLDCHGLFVNYSQVVVGYGINNSGYNYSTIRGCNIVQGNPLNPSADSYGVYIFKNSSYNVVFNNSITTNGTSGVGIDIEKVSYSNNVSSNTITTSGRSGYGLYLTSIVFSNNVYGNIITTYGSVGDGVYSYSTVYNNSIYNNNITINNDGNGNGIYMESNAYSNNIYNNNITSSGNGIYFYLTVFNNSFYGNIITATSYGIELIDRMQNNSFYSNVITSTGNNGIYFQESGSTWMSYNNYFYSNNITANQTGIYFDMVGTNYVYSNNITSKNSYGIFLDGYGGPNNAYNNSFYNNIITTYYGDGIHLEVQVYNNSIYGNNVTTLNGLGDGISLSYDAYNNSIYSNTILTAGNQSRGISLFIRAANNTIYDNNITTKNATGSYGIILVENVTNNAFFKNRVSSASAGIVINGSGDIGTYVKSNTFTNDTIIPCSTGCAANYNDIVLTSNVTDITFLNVSFNKSRVLFIPNNPVNPVEKNNITVQWYLSINVTNSTNNNPIANAQVVINDTFSNNLFNGTTDSTGSIPTQIATEFTLNVFNGTFNSTAKFTTDSCIGITDTQNITCFTPYNISVNLTTYLTASRSVDVNRSKFLNISMTPPTSPSVDLIGGGGFIIQNAAGASLAIFDSLGNVNIKGALMQNKEPTADTNDFFIANSTGGFNAIITNPEGNMIIKGTLSQNQAPPLSPTLNSFIIQNKSSSVVAYINRTGGMYIIGTLTENVVFG